MSRVDEIKARLAAVMPEKWTHSRHLQPEVGSQAAVWGPDGDCIALVCCNMAYDVTADDAAQFIAAAPEDISYLLGRVEKLEGLLKRLVAIQHTATLEEDAWELATEARTLLADESEENAHA